MSAAGGSPLLWLDAALAERAALAPLGALLGRTIAADFGEPATIVRLVPGFNGNGPSCEGIDEHGLTRIVSENAVDPASDAMSLGRTLAALRPGGVVIVDPSAIDMAMGRAIAARLEVPAGRAARWVRLGAGPRPAGPAWPEVVVAPVRPPSPSEAAGAWWRDERISPRCAAARALLRGLARPAPDVDGLAAEPLPERRATSIRCPARLDPGALARGGDLGLDRLPPFTRAALSRVARASTGRRVGLALGGSGTWGYAHVALAAGLAERGVPIDLVTGTSSGAFMGAYLCVLGGAGLELLVRRTRRFAVSVWAVALAPAALEAVLRADLGEVRLEELEVPLLPVATNLSRARAELFAAGPLSSAVRASASLPALFGATALPTGLYVDGAVAENVPVPLAEHAGCDLVIGSNPLPPPRATGRAPARLRDLERALALMIHRVGRHEPSPRRVLYNGPAHGEPLLGAARWGRTDEILAAARADEGLAAAIEQSASAWRSLSRSGAVLP